jgi:hypothetical protein
VITIRLARQTKNVNAGYIEAPNSEELGSQMDVDARQGSRNLAVLPDVLTEPDMRARIRLFGLIDQSVAASFVGR